MRAEMWSEFAPATETPIGRRSPTKRQALSGKDYNG